MQCLFSSSDQRLSPSSSQAEQPPPPRASTSTSTSTITASTPSASAPVSPSHELATILLFFVLVLGFLFFLLGFLLRDIFHCLCRRSILRKRRNGIDPAVLRSFPVLPYDVVRARCGPDCAVCLAEFENDESQSQPVWVRVLTVCGHVFHSECIDIWLESHVTCPICRSDLRRPPDEAIIKVFMEAREQLEKRGQIEELQGDEVIKGVNLV